MLKIILTGATGMVGEGVLHECLLHPAVEKVLIINRRASGITHPKLTEIIHKDFFDLKAITSQLAGYNTCFFCLGVSSVGMKKDEYYRFTYTLTTNFAETICQQNPGMTFSYISGSGTDSTEEGRLHWARVKGKTENDLMKLPFKKVYNFRPGILEATKGLKNTLKFYKYMSWLIPIIKLFTKNAATTLKELGLAMISAAEKGYEKQIIEVKDIHILAARMQR
jgi:uncharacterized protein YbjT (DUF2867 family)